MSRLGLLWEDEDCYIPKTTFFEGGEHLQSQLPSLIAETFLTCPVGYSAFWRELLVNRPKNVELDLWERTKVGDVILAAHLYSGKGPERFVYFNGEHMSNIASGALSHNDLDRWNRMNRMAYCQDRHSFYLMFHSDYYKYNINPTLKSWNFRHWVNLRYLQGCGLAKIGENKSYQDLYGRTSCGVNGVFFMDAFREYEQNPDLEMSFLNDGSDI